MTASLQQGHHPTWPELEEQSTSLMVTRVSWGPLRAQRVCREEASLRSSLKVKLLGQGQLQNQGDSRPSTCGPATGTKVEPPFKCISQEKGRASAGASFSFFSESSFFVTVSRPDSCSSRLSLSPSSQTPRREGMCSVSWQWLSLRLWAHQLDCIYLDFRLHISLVH